MSRCPIPEGDPLMGLTPSRSATLSHAQARSITPQ